MALGISKSIFRNSPSELSEWLVFGTYKAFKQIDQRFAPISLQQLVEMVNSSLNQGNRFGSKDSISQPINQRNLRILLASG